MIYDSIENLIANAPSFMPRVAELLPLLKAASAHSYEELQKMNFTPLDVRLKEYDTRPAPEVPFEAHKRMWDLQIVMAGEELIGCCPLADMYETVPYDEAADVAYYGAKGPMLKLEPGMAILVAPWDGHQPEVAVTGTPTHVKKLVVKLPW
ncbi:MAG: YhcH/YjgK/YiaL family protein [Synergistaceae bacterium]|nr:YhcH/YjgK/YiaL family protein [Synergistaceae bacterium]